MIHENKYEYPNDMHFKSWTNLLIEKEKRRWHWLNQSHREIARLSS